MLIDKKSWRGKENINELVCFCWERRTRMFTSVHSSFPLSLRYRVYLVILFPSLQLPLARYFFPWLILRPAPRYLSPYKSSKRWSLTLLLSPPRAVAVSPSPSWIEERRKFGVKKSYETVQQNLPKVFMLSVLFILSLRSSLVRRYKVLVSLIHQTHHHLLEFLVGDLKKERRKRNKLEAD